MKIIQVINAMISNQDLITNVIRNGAEYFFLYKNKHKWSIILNENGDYYLHLYPDESYDIETLASYNGAWENLNFVSYNTKELNTTEAIESFSELYRIVTNRLLGVDDIFNDILEGF